jgi:hypothetical protein
MGSVVEKLWFAKKPANLPVPEGAKCFFNLWIKGCWERACIQQNHELLWGRQGAWDDSGGGFVTRGMFEDAGNKRH